ncbi:hypothetical protein DFJ73DRAFT_819328 [Zopfochytrium polystomum]|nr:hypothetical protein DFJ73DRAFT_819328 [Zopfochytrium polystomum]
MDTGQCFFGYLSFLFLFRFSFMGNLFGRVGIPTLEGPAHFFFSLLVFFAHPASSIFYPSLGYMTALLPNLLLPPLVPS